MPVNARTLVHVLFVTPSVHAHAQAVGRAVAETDIVGHIINKAGIAGLVVAEIGVIHPYIRGAIQSVKDDKYFFVFIRGGKEEPFAVPADLHGQKPLGGVMLPVKSAGDGGVMGQVHRLPGQLVDLVGLLLMREIPVDVFPVEIDVDSLAIGRGQQSGRFRGLQGAGGEQQPERDFFHRWTPFIMQGSAYSVIPADRNPASDFRSSRAL